MPVTACEREWERKTTLTKDGLKATTIYIVTSDLEGVPLSDVYAALPGIGTTFPGYDDSTINSIDLEPTGPSKPIKSWKATVNYEPTDPNQNASDPTARPALIRRALSKYKKAVFKDAYGKQYTSSAGEPFDPPIEIDDSRPILTITKNVIAVSDDTFTKYRDHVNEKAWFNFAAYTVKLSGMETTSKYENRIRYEEWTVEFEINPDGWVEKVPDRGYYVRSLRRFPRLKAIEDITGRVLNSPANLDGNGLLQDQTLPPVLLEFDPYPAIDFAGLNLP